MTRSRMLPTIDVHSKRQPTTVNSVSCKDDLDGLLPLIAQKRYEHLLHRHKQNRDTVAAASGHVWDAVSLKNFVESSFGNHNTALDRAGRTALRRLKKRVWEEAFLFTVGDIPPTELLILSLDTCFEDSFFWDPDRLEARQIRNLIGKNHVASGPYRDARVFARNNMKRFTYSLGDPKQEDIFGDATILKQIIGKLLKRYGSCQVLDHEDALKHFRTTVLITVNGRPQDAHQDYSSAQLYGRGRKRKQNEGPDACSALPSDPLPWSADIPLSEGGFYINIWHGFDPKFAGGVDPEHCPVQNWNIKVHVPFKSILLWRGDLVHGGGYDNRKNNGALRLHWYIPMKKDDIATVAGSLGNTHRNIAGSSVSLKTVCPIREHYQ